MTSSPAADRSAPAAPLAVVASRPLGDSSTGASRVVHELSRPYVVTGWDEDDPGTPTRHVLTSAVVAMFSGAETYVFPCDADGDVTDWGELPGSFRGDLDHDTAISGFLIAANIGDAGASDDTRDQVGQ